MATKSTKDTEVKSDKDILALFQETHFVNYVLSVAKFPYWGCERLQEKSPQP